MTALDLSGQKKTVPFKSSRKCSDNLSGLGQPRSTRDNTIYQPINSSCSSLRRTTVAGAGALEPAPPTLLHQPQTAAQPSHSHSREPHKPNCTQGRLPTTLHATEKVLSVALEYSTNLNIPPQDFLKKKKNCFMLDLENAWFRLKLIHQLK